MKFQVLTLFPEMITEAVSHSVIGRAQKNGLISVSTINIRDFSCNRHMRVDDYPYGGGAGMVMEAEPVFRAVSEAKRRTGDSVRVVYLTPQAEVLTQTKVEELAGEEALILLCGHYEGIDDRVLSQVVTDYISIGDYVLTGGELGALVLIDAVSRFVPGVLGNDESAGFESFQDNLLEYPHYTRPEIWHGIQVPEVLFSGDHEKVREWRLEQSLIRTKERRPDLLEKSRRIRTIWFGKAEIGEAAEEMTELLSRFGSVENYNRKTLQKRRNHLTGKELLLIFTEDDISEADSGESAGDLPEQAAEEMTPGFRFRNLTGEMTACLLVRCSSVPRESGAEADVSAPGEKISALREALEENGFRIAGSLRLNPGQADEMRGAALAIRRKIERGTI